MVDEHVEVIVELLFLFGHGLRVCVCGGSKFALNDKNGCHPMYENRWLIQTLLKIGTNWHPTG